MNILFLGPQGSGKGTQARLLSEKFGFYYFESGAFLRELAKNNPVVKDTIDAGKLVPNEEMSSYIAAFFDQKQIYDDIIFDGFPRTVEQYKFFKDWLTDKNVKLDFAFVLNISEKMTIERLSARRMDLETGKIYNLITDKPPASVDELKLVQREDDKSEAIKERLLLYKKMTLPLIEELKKDTKVISLDGEKPIGEIQEELGGYIKNG